MLVDDRTMCYCDTIWTKVMFDRSWNGDNITMTGMSIFVSYQYIQAEFQFSGQCIDRVMVSVEYKPKDANIGLSFPVL